MGGVALEQRVERAAEAALEEQRYVSAIDVLLGLGWLAPPHLDEWRQGRVQCLERVVEASLPKQSTTMRVFRRWAQRRGLVSSETRYVARTRDRRPLRFSVSGAPEIERAYRTHRNRRSVDHAGRRPGMSALHGHGSPGLPTRRRCRAHSSRSPSRPQSWSSSAAVASATSAKGCLSRIPRSPRHSGSGTKIADGRSGPAHSLYRLLSLGVGAVVERRLDELMVREMPVVS